MLEIGDRGHVRTVVLNRPEKRNALTHELAWGIVAAVEAAARDDAVRVVALTGRGEAFCAGLDLSDAGEDASPLPAQGHLLDDVSWVGRFALVLRHVCDKAIGYEPAMRFLLENRTVEADEALRLGFVGEVVDDDRFEARLSEYCAFLAEGAPLAARLTKRGIVRATGIDLEAQVRYELANIR